MEESAWDTAKQIQAELGMKAGATVEVGEAVGAEAEERAHLAQVEEWVAQALARAEALAVRMEEGHRETGAHLASVRGELSPEEARLSAFELNRMDVQAASAALSRERLEKLAASPYFARVDFVEANGGSGLGASMDDTQIAGAEGADDGDVSPAATYLGRFAFNWGSRSVVSDWRSPVAGLFYDFEPGPAYFETPQGPREGVLTCKRQIAVEDGRLLWAADSSSSVRDEVLARALGRSSDAKMHDIVASIQREQNAVIRDETPGTLVIQGVAGSGKTSIALHRIAYLLYRQKEHLSAQSVAILSPNRVFSDYISGVLPELGEEPVTQWSVADLAARLLEGEAKVARAHPWTDEVDPARRARARAKGTEEFATALTAWVDEALSSEGAPRLFEPHDLAVGGGSVSAAWLAERFAAYAPVPFDERLDLIAGDAREQAHSSSFGRYGRDLPTRRELAGRLRRMMTAKNPLQLYRRFLAERGQSALLKSAGKSTVEWEDAFPLALCRLAFTGPDGLAASAGIRHLVIDEMQDLAPVAHEVIARAFRCDKTILGDVNQLVDDRDAALPSQVAAHYPDARVVTLMRSYRSTYEITELAARVKPIAGLEAVERHGEEPRFIRCGDTLGVLTQIGEAVERWRATGRRTLGIICKSDFLAARYAELLARDHALTLLTDDASAYPGGIVVSSVRLAKGLEFDEAVLLDADARQYATEPDRNLLYVAITRAMHRLTILYRDEPSCFLAG